MKKYMLTMLPIIGFIIVISLSFSHTIEYEVPYPEGYRTWTHVKTGLVGPANPNFLTSGGYHHIYANEKAMLGYNTGIFPEGSVLVFDVINFKEQNGNFPETDRKQLDVMLKDSTRYSSTGGWGYDEFRGDSHTERNITQAVRIQCFNCHAKNEDYVFSMFRK
ncbi:MAG: cytochrome P460 family protein [Saprospiraceae bacterium]